MKQYKVIKEFACAKKGDVLTYNEDSDLFEFDITSNGGYRTMFVDEETADEFVEEGFLEAFDKEPEMSIEEDKLNKVSEMIDEMLYQYEQDGKTIQNKYDKGEVPTCVKVEADTVHYHITKVLNKIKEVINS
jgi:hypothetical protein|nr:MAG TPA: hypothetical protein [Podoviridae sp. ctY3D12]